MIKRRHGRPKTSSGFDAKKVEGQKVLPEKKVKTIEKVIKKYPTEVDTNK